MQLKHFFFLCLLCLSQALWAVDAPPVRRLRAPQREKPLKIVFDNDVHGSIERYQYLAGYRDALRKTGYPVLTVSVGDYLQGSAYASMSQGKFCVDMMNVVGYDVVAVGNHDIDYGLQHLMSLKDSLKGCTMICANLMDSSGHRCLPAYTICEVENYRVAFVGVLTTATEQLEANVVLDRQGNRLCSFAKDSLIQVVQQAINEAKQQNPDWVILLTHMGEQPLNDHWASWQLVEHLNGVDVVIDGHSHSVVNSTMVPKELDRNVIVAQTGSGMKNVGCVTLMHDEAPRVKLHAYSTLSQSDTVLQTYLQVEQLMQPILGKVVGHASFELSYNMDGKRAVRSRETNLGDLVADAYRNGLGTDIGWVNGGGIRTGIGMGDISYGHIVGVSPFNNFMCVAEVTGRMLADALEECYHDCPNDLGSFAQISGIRCVIDTTKSNVLSWDSNNTLQVLGLRRVSDIEIFKNGDWHPIVMNDIYTIGSTNYVIYDGELQGLKNARLLKDKVMTDSECLQSYIVTTLGGDIPTTYAQAQERIRIKENMQQ